MKEREGEGIGIVWRSFLSRNTSSDTQLLPPTLHAPTPHMPPLPLPNLKAHLKIPIQAPKKRQPPKNRHKRRIRHMLRRRHEIINPDNDIAVGVFVAVQGKVGVALFADCGGEEFGEGLDDAEGGFGRGEEGGVELDGEGDGCAGDAESDGVVGRGRCSVGIGG